MQHPLTVRLDQFFSKYYIWGPTFEKQGQTYLTLLTYSHLIYALVDTLPDVIAAPPSDGSSGSQEINSVHWHPRCHDQESDTSYQQCNL